MARLVLLLTVHLVLCFLPSLQARDAWHHGQYGPEGLVCWFFTMLLALCSLLCLQALDARLHGRHGPQDSWQFLDKVFFMPVVVLRVVSWLQFITVVVTPCCFAEADPHVPGCSDDHLHSTVAAP